ncbi:LysR family transcriptional regulator [Fulvimarina endophytica]|uniref:LysR family transcriptional regulator n=1 Tax=Fulvimarina endophytica TaxID=2293836 RepID=A0A371X5G8_9HYPH|nr:LysR family transcriptional regulator [Fulvimarina endophytica]RFC64478.1 LysR family transcriptional regulator [Fulvimarina endophytica]
MRAIDWNNLNAFLAVARAGKLTLAARRLGVDHSTLSRRIAALEASLATSLFERSPNGYRMTEDGRRVLAEVQDMEDAVVRIQRDTDAAGGSIEGPIRLTMPEGFSTGFLVHHLAALKAEHPRLTVELIADPSIVSLGKREADIAVMMERPAQGQLVSKKLCDYEYGLYASRDYLASLSYGIASIADMNRSILIGYIPDRLPTPAHDYLAELLPGRQADLQVSNILTQVEATAAGLGLACLPAFIAGRRPELVRLLADDCRFERSYWIVTHANARYAARTRAVKDFLAGLVARNARFFRPSAS